MSDLSRRNFLKTSAAGIVIAGAGGLALTKAAHAMNDMAQMQRESDGSIGIRSQCNVPGAPDRQGDTGDYYIVCPSDDPELAREYSALIHVTIDGETRTETPIMEGVDFYPFDGSYWNTSTNVSANDFYLCRAICTGASGPGDMPEFIPSNPMAAAAMPDMTRDFRPKIKPPHAKIKEKIPHNKIKYKLDWFDDMPAGAKGLRLARLTLFQANDDGSMIRPPTIVLPAQPEGNVYGRQKEGIRRKLREGKRFRDVFGTEEELSLSGNVYFLHTEVIYDFGKSDDPKVNAMRYRGSSAWLKVDMRQPIEEQEEERPRRKG